MNKIFHLIIILIAVSNQIIAQTVKIRERTETESHKEAKAASFYTKNQLQFDPMWIIRGTVMFAGERTIGDDYSIRTNVGVGFHDFIDKKLLNGLFSGNLNYISNTPQLAFGLEGRYYYNDNASFDSPYLGVGVLRRAYNYRTVSKYTNSDGQYVYSMATSKSIVLYVRYGSTHSIAEWEKSSLLFEYGLGMGYSIDAYTYNIGNGMQSEITANLWILPHTGLGFTF